MNAETSVAKVGFFGNMYQKLWCLTHIETLRYLLWIFVHVYIITPVLSLTPFGTAPGLSPTLDL